MTVTRRYSSPRLATSSQQFTLTSDPQLVSTGAGTGTAKTFTITPNQLISNTYIVEKLIVSYECTGTTGADTTNIEVNGINSETRKLDASPQYWTYEFITPVTDISNSIVIKIETTSSSAANTRDARVDAIATVIV